MRDNLQILAQLFVLLQCHLESLPVLFQLEYVVARLGKNATFRLAVKMAITLALATTRLWYDLRQLRYPVVYLVPSSPLDLIVRRSPPLVSLNKKPKVKSAKRWLVGAHLFKVGGNGASGFDERGTGGNCPCAACLVVEDLVGTADQVQLAVQVAGYHLWHIAVVEI